MSTETTHSPSSSSSYESDKLRPRLPHAGAGFQVATGSGGEKPIPHNPEAEEAVIGALLIDRETIIKVAPLLRPADFFSEERAAVYQAVLELYEQRTPSDLITLRDDLRRRGRLGEGEGQVKAGYLLNLMRSTASPVHVEHYAKIVLRYAVMRRLIGAGAQVTALGFDEALETQEMVDQAQQLIYDVVQQGVKRDAVKVGAILEEYFDRLAYLHEHKGDIVGVPSGYTDLDKLTGGFQQSDLIILAARPSVGKCLPGHTLIDDPESGERRTLKSYFDAKITSVMGISEKGAVRPAKISDWIDSGIQPTYRVGTRLGRQVEVTGHHPFLTAEGWVPLHDLKVGDYIGVPRILPVFGQEASWSFERVRLLAYFIAEGCLTHSSPQFTNADPDLVADFTRCVKAEFPSCEVQLQAGSQIDYRITQPYKPGGRLGTVNPLTVWLKEVGLWDIKDEDKSFPACVWRWDAERLAEFLKVLLSCDGSIYGQPYSSSQASGALSPHIEFSVASKQLAQDVNHAFVRFGIVARFYHKNDRCWRVHITDGKSVRRYQALIGWLGAKESRFSDLRIRTVAENNGNYGHVPQAVWNKIQQARHSAGLSMVELARQARETTSAGKYGGYNPHIRRNLPQNRLAGYAQVLDNDELRFLSSDEIIWDAITSIDYAGEQQVYDLTVPDGHNFIAQDVCVHNTSLALGVAYNVAMKYKRPVGVFSLEMSREQLVQRMLSMETGVDSHRLRTGYIDETEWDRISRAFGRLATAPLYIDDSAGITIQELRSKARRLHSEYALELLIIDYLQLMTGGKVENRVQEVSEISRNLKGLARELNIPVICLSQLSRAVENRTNHIPQLSDLRESGCLIGDTPVFLPDKGVYQPIESLAGRSGFNVLALNPATWKFEARPVTHAFTTGYKPVFRLTTRLGRTIRATANHKFLTVDGWRRLDELSPGQHLALPRTLPGPEQATMTNSELALLGHLIGDGCALPRHVIQYTTNDITLAEKVAGLAVEVFGDKINPRIQKERDWYQVYLTSSYKLTHGVRNPVAAWLDRMNIFGLRSYEKRVPKEVFAQPAASIALFLRHLWATDGCVYLSPNTGYYPAIYYASSSEELCRNVQSLLLRLNINARLKRQPQNGKGRDQFHVIVGGRPDIELFLRTIGSLGQHKILNQAAIGRYFEQRAAPNTNRDGLPRELWRGLVVPTLQMAGLTGRQVQAGLGNSYCGTSLYKQNFSRERATRLAQVIGSAELDRMAQSDVYWDEVISIVADGEAQVYDLTVDGLHNFVAGDIVVHNSIEQDADIVMFIYREELYNPETEKKNIAEIHVAKHRNGPVDVVPLHFHHKTTRFADCEPYRQPGR